MWNRVSQQIGRNCLMLTLWIMKYNCWLIKTTKMIRMSLACFYQILQLISFSLRILVILLLLLQAKISHKIKLHKLLKQITNLTTFSLKFSMLFPKTNIHFCSVQHLILTKYYIKMDKFKLNTHMGSITNASTNQEWNLWSSI